MLSLENLIAFTILALVMSMIPGADTILIIKNTLTYGVKAGCYTILGSATGLLFWTIVAVLGLSLVVAQSVFLFNIIKYLGAAYLIYLGISALIKKPNLPEENPKTEEKIPKSLKSHYLSSYLQGTLSIILNPKTVLLYITFMPQFINLNSDNVNQQLMTLGIILISVAISWFLILAFLIDYIKRWFQKPVFQKIFQKSTGLLLIAFGIRTAL